MPTRGVPPLSSRWRGRCARSRTASGVDVSRACLTPGPARQRPVLTTARTPSPAPAPSRSLLEDRPRAAGLAEPDWHPDLGHPRETAPSEGPVWLRAAHLGGPVTMCSVQMAALSWGACGLHSRPRQAWRLQVGAQGACMALGAAVQNFIEKAAGSRVAPGLVGVGLAASGSAVGQEQGAAGTPSVQLGKGPCSRTSRRPHRGQRQLRALALLQAGAALSSLHALPSSGRKKGPRVVSLGRPPSRRPGPRCCSHAGRQHLGCWARPAQCPELAPPLRLPGQCPGFAPFL